MAFAEIKAVSAHMDAQGPWPPPAPRFVRRETVMCGRVRSWKVWAYPK
jgi:hypothetical protein